MPLRSEEITASRDMAFRDVLALGPVPLFLSGTHGNRGRGPEENPHKQVARNRDSTPRALLNGTWCLQKMGVKVVLFRKVYPFRREKNALLFNKKSTW